MKRHLLSLILVTLSILFQLSGTAAGSVILGWNNLGMHCMDSSYSEFSILPPYNTIEAQLVVGGKLVTAGSGYTLTYEAVADPDGSINTTSVGKGNWFDFSAIIFGKPITSADEGLNAWNMPGPLNSPQTLLFENATVPAPGASALVNWFRAEGIPLTPYDDAGNKNPYPLMRLVARDATSAVIAQSDIVLPVSDEMDCRSCHGANTLAAAAPANGWITDPVPGREYRLNILQLHDERQFGSYSSLYNEALKAKGLDPAGLYPTVTAGKPILCASCHSSEALGTASFSSANGKGTVPPLTSSMHTRHAGVLDPTLNMTLNDSNNRSACYRCHPGSTTRCLRGAMGSAVAADGSMEMQCQSCHGTMSRVGAGNRVGWFMEPKCQNCHTGTATSNNGQIRFTSVFDATGAERVPVDQTFATNADTPAPGISLYRFSAGHGGLQCSACHGSTHAEFPASHRNDNIRNTQLQGHAGVMAECASCHTAGVPTTPNGGPHGMHPIGQSWVGSHHDSIGAAGGLTACQACHGLDNRGTELSRVQGPRTLSFKGSSFSLYRGATIGCYSCHQGPSSDSANGSIAPAVGDVTAQTMAGVPVSMILPGSVAGVTLRIISQPKNGSVGLSNGIATYFPFIGFTGSDSFTYAGYDGAKNSILATGTILVNAYDATVLPPAITASPVGQTVVQGNAVTLTVAVTGSDPLSYQWYKDGWPVAGASASSLLLNGAVADGGSYLVLVRNGAGTAISTPALVTVLVPPSIVTDPAGQTVLAGSAVTLSVSAAGTAPFSYQWYKDGLVVAKGTSATLRLTNVATTASGNYQVHVTNSAGAVDSAVAVLLVQSPPVISTQPKTTTVTVGTAVALSVAATGTDPMTYQWYKDTVAVVGATAGSLAIPAAAVTDAGSYYVIITNPLGSVTSGTAVVSVTPTITGFTPATAAEGMTVTISGINFTGVTGVAFNGIAALFTVDSDAQITTVVPVGATTGKISVTGLGGGVTGGATFTVVPVPAITALAPALGPVGTKVVITGSGFGTGTVPVTFNGVAAVTVLRNSTTQVTATVPVGATTGPVVLTTAGGSAASPLLYTVTYPPVLSSFTPATSAIGGMVVITGSAFTGATAVTFNGVAAAFTIVSDTQLSATVPAGATSGKISVTNGDGTTASTASFTVIPAPTVTSFTPASGIIGTKVVITGTNLTGATSVTFNGVAAATVTLASATSISATVPPGATTGMISVTTPGGTVASATSYTVTFPPVVSSFSPASSAIGGTVVITGSALTGATAVTFNGVAALFTVVSDTQLSATVPAGATSGKISVTNGDGTMAGAASFTVIPAPTITSFTPASGIIGTKVVITGTNLTGATSVTFNGVAAATVTLASATSITATVPAGATSGLISVTTPGGTVASATPYTVTFPPVLSSFTPATSAIGGTVVITGSAFTGATAVTFNGVAAAFTIVSDTQLSATVPAGATSGKISVTNGDGTTASTASFTVIPAPTVTSFTPASGIIGTKVVITGTNLTGATSVTFNGVAAATVTLASATSITATVPAGATSGLISVTTPGGTVASATPYTVTFPPVLSSFTPATSAIGGTVVITGSAFTGTTAVTFNGVAAAFTIVSDTQLSVTVPAGATSGKISVTNGDGTTAGAASFTVIPAPTVTSFTPASGIIGTKVVITGTNLTGATSVTFNGVVAATVTLASATSITATVPVGAISGMVSVTTPGGTAASVTPYTVTLPLPTLTAISPATGPVGTLVTLTGTNFTGATSVSFNGIAATSFTVVSATSLTATVPAGAATGKVSVTTPGGSAGSTGSFTLILPPTITSFTPASGIVGVKVTITGTNLTGATGVTFNGIAAATVTLTSATSISATVPPGATSGPISITTPGGTVTSAATFTVTLPAPTVSALSPASGVVGALVTVTGTNFTGATAVTFNGVAAASFTVVSATSLTATVPAGATTGKIGVTAPGGTATSTASFTVILPPTITSFTPASGAVGVKVTITGTNLTGATGVTFNGIAAATVTLTSATSISATVPPGATSGPISITTPGGTVTSAATFTVTLPAPTVSALSPASGVVGALVTVTGTNFTGATAVTFNGVAAASFTVVSATSLTATVPAGATTGKIGVTAPGGTATSTASFTVILPPTITSFTPATGPVGTKVTIAGTNLSGATAISFNGLAATTVTLTSATSISATVPVGATTGIISVTTLGGTATSATGYTVTIPLPTVTKLTPATGGVGTSVTLTGTNFTGATAVLFTGATAATPVSAPFTVISATSIVTAVPAGAKSGKISVTTPGGTGSSTASFTVGATAVLPVITGFAPASGPVGTIVTVTGINLAGVTFATVGGIPAAVTVLSATSLTITVPVGAVVGAGTLSVTTAGGSGSSATTYTVL